jgi:hypothetical protein
MWAFMIQQLRSRTFFEPIFWALWCYPVMKSNVKTVRSPLEPWSLSRSLRLICAGAQNCQEDAKSHETDRSERDPMRSCLLSGAAILKQQWPTGLCHGDLRQGVHSCPE